MGDQESARVLPPLQRYQRGWLAYWESELKFSQGAPCKGFVSLAKITSVHHEREGHDGRCVLVRHTKGEREDELLLMLPDKRGAEEFSYVLWEFLSKMRGEW